MLRIVFFGTPAFAVPTLDALLASRHEVVGVVTQPDRPTGRGQRVAAPPVKASATAHGIPVWQPERLKDEVFLEAYRDLAPDLGVVAAYGKILPEVVLQIPRLGLLNVHASLLPRWRGASPIHHAVMSGDTETGVTIMRVVKALDAGAMLATDRRPIGPDETSADIEHDLARRGAALLVATLDDVEAGVAVETPQDDALATYAPRIEKTDGIVDWRLGVTAIHNLVRGLRPWPLAQAWLQGERVMLLRTRAFEGPIEPAAPGTIVQTKPSLVVAAGDGRGLEILELQPEGRRAMAARDFLAGRAIRNGAAFTRPDPR
jgi:methionyl-tRNA formyltransferase